MIHLFDVNIDAKDSTFKAIRDNPQHHQKRIVLERLWQKYEPYADTDFISEFAKEFDSRFWEMYLACALMERQYTLVQRHKRYGIKKKGCPDICLECGTSRIWIEAVAPKSGTGPDAVPPEPDDSHFIISEETEDKLILRWTNAIYEKAKKHGGYVKKGILTPSEPYVIAISGQDVNLAWTEDDLLTIIKAVLPFGRETVTFDADTLGILNHGYSYKPKVDKASGNPVSTTTFLDPESAGISGIIYAVPSIPVDPDDLGEEFLLIHNPLARNSLALGWLRGGTERWVEDDMLKHKKWSKSDVLH